MGLRFGRCMDHHGPDRVFGRLDFGYTLAGLPLARRTAYKYPDHPRRPIGTGYFRCVLLEVSRAYLLQEPTVVLPARELS